MLGFILARANIREYDQRITAYTRERGKMELLARGVKKITSRNSPFLEPPSLLELAVASGKDFGHLTTAQPVNLFSRIRSSLVKLRMSTFCIHLLTRLLPSQQPDEHIFDLVYDWLIFLNNSADPKSTTLYAFIIRFLSALGFAPVLDRCAICGSLHPAEPLFFSAAYGGIVEKKCLAGATRYPAVNLSTSSLVKFNLLLTQPWERLLPLVLSPSEEAIADSFLLFHSEGQVAAWTAGDKYSAGVNLTM